MNKSICILVAILSSSLVLQAGPPAVAGKESKQQTVFEEPCFKAHEWQFDTFGQYSVGKGGHSGVFQEHGWGGGVGINYFFTQHIGVGVDAAWLAIQEDSRFERNHGDSDYTTLHNFSSSLIFRAPINSACLAPYIYAGGGFHVDGKQWASGHAGAGLEYRIKPNRLGIFVDSRWTYLGDREERGDLNFFSGRIGFRVVF